MEIIEKRTCNFDYKIIHDNFVFYEFKITHLHKHTIRAKSDVGTYTIFY